MAVGNINGAYQVKVTQNAGVKGGIFKQNIQPNTIFSYVNTEGKTNNVEFAKYELESNNDYTKRMNVTKTYLTAMNSYSTEDNPEITPKEVFQIKRNIAKNTKGASVQRHFGQSTDSTKRNDYFQLLDLYSDPESDGGKNITPQEQSEVVDTFVKWYYKN